LPNKVLGNIHRQGNIYAQNSSKVYARYINFITHHTSRYVVSVPKFFKRLLYCDSHHQHRSRNLFYHPPQLGNPSTSSGTGEKQWRSKEAVVRNTFLDLLGLALTMGAAIWLGRWAGGYAGHVVGIESGQTWGMIAGIVAGMGAGFAGALMAGRVWGRVSSPLRVETSIKET
jgi:hypothetical protein